VLLFENRGETARRVEEQYVRSHSLFTQSVEYALRAVVYLASQPDQAQKTADIAIATQVPGAYLSKVLQGLRKGQIVTLSRGVGGGVMLARSPDALTILDIVNAVDPIKRITTCPLGLISHGTKLCSLHFEMDNAFEALQVSFAAKTIAQLLRDENSSYPLCSQRTAS